MMMKELYSISNKNIVFKKSFVDEFRKSNTGSKLEYFKKELLAILDQKEKEEAEEYGSINKAFEVNELYKSLVSPFCFMAKGGKAAEIGEIRTWNGKKYKKMPNKKWVRIYDTHDKHTEISIARLKGRVRKAQSIDELFEIVMNNTHRFSDRNGKPLPIVEELKKEVDAKKHQLKGDKIKNPVHNLGARNDKVINKNNIKLDAKDFPEQFNKGKWKAQTKILMDFLNTTEGDTVVKSLFKKLGALKNNIPFGIKKTDKKFPNGCFTLGCNRYTLKPEEQTLRIEDITDENEDLKKSSCMKALHEIMHMIDFSCRKDKEKPDYASTSNEQIINAINNTKLNEEEIDSLDEHFKEFRAKEKEIIFSLNEKSRAIKELGEQYEHGAITTYEEYGKKYRAIKEEWQTGVKEIKELRSKEIAVSQYTDILDAISGGVLHDDRSFGGHGKDYYRKESNKANEIVANYASLLASGSEYADRLKENYPELAEAVYNHYKAMLEG